MKNIIPTILLSVPIAFCSQAYADEWKELSGYSLHQLYSCEDTTDLLKSADINREASIQGTAGLSWPDGRQALVTYIEQKQDGKKWLYKCIDYYSTDMQRTGQACYELRKSNSHKTSATPYMEVGKCSKF